MPSAGRPLPAERPVAAARGTQPAGSALATHSFVLRVYCEDTDAAGMVYHANYLKYAERGRSEMLRSLGFPHRQLHAEDGVGFAVRRAAVDYLAPARLEDSLTVDTTLTGIGAATLSVNQRIRRGDELLADIDILVACIGGDGRPRRLPRALRAVLAGDGSAVPRAP